jgi:hypothetical protein
MVVAITVESKETFRRGRCERFVSEEDESSLRDLEESLRRREGMATFDSKSSAVQSGDDGLLKDESDGNEKRSYAPSRGSELDDGAVATLQSDDDRKFAHADESSNLCDVDELSLVLTFMSVG